MGERRRRWELIIGVVGALAVLSCLLVACVTVLPTWIVGPDADSATLSRLDRLKAENDVRASLLQGLAGLLALTGVGLGAAATLRQIRVSREGNTIGLFTKAIDQLASETISVRQGGVYAMELLARLDSAYRGPIHALLTAFVRQRMPWPPVANPHDLADPPRGQRHDGLPDDVGAAMGALSRRRMVEGSAWSELERVDLRNADLAGADLRHVCFLGSNLTGARLTGANLSNSTLSHVMLTNCDLSGADLTGANLDGADLAGAVSDEATRWPAGFSPNV